MTQFKIGDIVRYKTNAATGTGKIIGIKDAPSKFDYTVSIMTSDTLPYFHIAYEKYDELNFTKEELKPLSKCKRKQ